jgi:DNA-binding transcriptional regulator YiaG
MSNDKIETSGRPMLRAWMKRQDLSRAEAAIVLHTTVHTLASWLDGRRRPGLSAALLIEAATSEAVDRHDWLTADERLSMQALRKAHG